MRRMIGVAGAMALSLGCAWIHDAAPVAVDILKVVSDAAQIIATLEALSAAHFAEHPDAHAQAECDEAFAAAHLALSEAQRADDSLGASRYSSFRKAHAQLVATLARNGVRLGVGSGAATLGIPQPMVGK